MQCRSSSLSAVEVAKLPYVLRMYLHTKYMIADYRASMAI